MINTRNVKSTGLDTSIYYENEYYLLDRTRVFEKITRFYINIAINSLINLKQV
jgi:hypothetical protein